MKHLKNCLLIVIKFKNNIYYIMYLNNDYININNGTVKDFNIDYDYDNAVNLIFNIIKKSRKFNKYPSSLDIIEFLNKKSIYDNSSIDEFVKSNETQLNYKSHICAVIQIYSDTLNYDTLNKFSKIFDQIYILNYTNNNLTFDDKNINILNCNPTNSYFNFLFISIDLLNLYNYIFNLDISHDISLIKETELINCEYTIKNYLSKLDLPYNYQFLELLKFKKLYQFNEYLNIHSSKNQYLICQKNTKKYYKFKKIIKIPIILTNYSLYQDSYIQNYVNKYNFFNIHSNDISSFQDYIVKYHKIINDKNNCGDTYRFILNNLKLQHFKLNLRFYEKHNKLINYNFFDYQILDNSIMIVLNNNDLLYDFILLIYFINLTINFKKKIFIKWKNKNILLSEIFNDEFYNIDDTSDNVSNYSVSIYRQDMNISLNEITYIITSKLPTFYFDDYLFLEHLHLFDYNNTIRYYFEKYNDNFIVTEISNEILFNLYFNIHDNVIHLSKIYDDINNKELFQIIRFILIKKSQIFIYEKLSTYDKYIAKNLINLKNYVNENKIININNFQLSYSELENVINYDNLVLSFNCNQKISYNLNESSFVSKIFTINSNYLNLSYKNINIKSDYNNSEIINFLVKKSNNNHILISDSSFSDDIFRITINEFNFYCDLKVLYISRSNFDKLNGFNENIANFQHAILDLCNRCKLYKIKNYYNIDIKYEHYTIWGSENTTKNKYLKKNKKIYEII